MHCFYTLDNTTHAFTITRNKRFNLLTGRYFLGGFINTYCLETKRIQEDVTSVHIHTHPLTHTLALSRVDLKSNSISKHVQYVMSATVHWIFPTYVDVLLYGPTTLSSTPTTPKRDSSGGVNTTSYLVHGKGS
jgi:hypothetical protein